MVKGQGDFYDSTYNALICVDLAFSHDPVRSFFGTSVKGSFCFLIPVFHPHCNPPAMIDNGAEDRLEFVLVFANKSSSSPQSVELSRNQREW